MSRCAGLLQLPIERFQNELKALNEHCKRVIQCNGDFWNLCKLHLVGYSKHFIVTPSIYIYMSWYSVAHSRNMLNFNPVMFVIKQITD